MNESPAETLVLNQIGQIAVPVSDIERAILFYRDTLGMRFLFQAPPGLAFFDLSGVRLMLDGPAKAQAGSSSVIYYKVADLHAAFTTLSKRGVHNLCTKRKEREVRMKFLMLMVLCLFTPAIAHADAKAGEKKGQICLLCHKPNNPTAYVPTLESQTREYLYNQIKAFKEKRRPDPAMQTNVATLSDRDMRDIADYFASQKPVRESFKLDAEKVTAGKAKAAELKCGTCHMPDFSGKKEVPRLAGLHPKYTGAQIVAFTLAKRPHPPVDGMTAISEDDAEALAQYFAQLE